MTGRPSTRPSAPPAQIVSAASSVQPPLKTASRPSSGIARTDDIAALHGEGPAGIAKLVKSTKARFLLLAGDADTVPTFIQPTALAGSEERKLATDRPYDVAVGRFPADTVAELEAMVAKTVAYEKSPPPGAWRKKIAFVSGEGGFGPMIDRVIERQFTLVIKNEIPAAYDVEVAYAKPNSRYCFYPPKFNENALRLLNEGPLFYVYVGHGRRDAFDVVRFQKRVYPIFKAKDVENVEAVGGPPIMVVLACNTGEYDSRAGDSIGELLFKRKRGPVAFIGGTRITQPYGNALFGRSLVGSILRKRTPRLGEALRAAADAVLAPDTSTFRKQSDAMATMVQGPKSLEPMRRDVVRHYNLLGDPALRVHLPEESITLSLEGDAGPGARLKVRGTGASGQVEVTFECARDIFYHPTYKASGTLEERMAYRYTNANNKVIVRQEAAATKEGTFEVTLELPEKLRPGTYTVKAWSKGAMGSAAVVIQPEPAEKPQ